MKQFLLTILIIPLFAFNAGDKFLNKITLYQKDSYFKQKVYADHNWKSFYKLPEAQSTIDPNNYDLHLLNAAVFFATDKMRESKHAKPLQFSPQLRNAAVVHTEQMVEKNFFDHFNRSTPALRSPEQRIGMFGITASTYLAENVDYTYVLVSTNTTYIQLAEKIVEDFYDSPPHRKNMLGKEFTHLGCAAIFEPHDKEGARYVKATQDFSANY